MSLVKMIKAQLGLSSSASQNFTLTAEAADGTMKMSRGNAGAPIHDIMTVSVGGDVDFPQMPRSMAANGHAKLPGGLIIQWGTIAHATTDGTTVAVTFPVAFPNACLSVAANDITSSQAAGVAVNNKTTTGCNLFVWNRTGGTAVGSSANWIAIGY